MSGYRLTPRARSDLDDIAEFIARDNPQAATRVIRAIRAKCRAIGKNAWIGAAREELEPGLRCVPAGKYVIFYRSENPVQVIRVLHGARDIPSVFKADD